MKIERRDSHHEKRILAAMVMDKAVLARLSAHWQNNLFRNKWANLVAGWCVKYYKQYSKAPKRQLEALFEQWAERNDDETTHKLVESFLVGVSEDYKSRGGASAEYIIDLAAEHFNKNKLLKLAEGIQADITNGRLDEAEKRQREFNKMEFGVGVGVDVLHDEEAIKAAFHEGEQELITYPGALGNFFRHMLTRDALVAFMAPPKRGKTFWLLDMAWRAMKQQRKTAVFQVGDMSQNQVMRRFMARASKRPLKPCIIQYPRAIDIPPSKRRASVDHITKEYKDKLDWETALAACKRITGEQDDPNSLLRLSTHPNGTISVGGILAILDGWERTGWIADVIVIDYADLLNPMTGKEHWEKVDQTWRHLRGLSQARHCLVVTANQADAAALRADTVRADNFSGSVAVLRHVTGMIGISQTDAEKRIGVYRLNWLEAREIEFDISTSIHVAGCLGVANPAVKSIFPGR